MGKTWVISIFCITLALQTQFASSDEIQHATEAVTSPTPTLSSEPSYVLKAVHPFVKFASEQKCDSLLALTPPGWISLHPSSGIFANSNNWPPVCGPYGIHQILKSRPTGPVDIKKILGTQAQPTETETLESLNTQTKRLDACAKPKSDRFSNTRADAGNNCCLTLKPHAKP